MHFKFIFFPVLFFAIISLNSCKKSTSSKYPQDGLVSYFNFDNNLIDVMGNTPTGENIGGAPFVDGFIGIAISVNGINQHVKFNRDSYHNANKISIAFWFKKTTFESLFFLVCSDFISSASSSGEASSAGFGISIPETNTALGAFEKSTWTHYVGTYDGNNIKIYINGQLKETISHPGDIAPVDPIRNLTIGRFLETDNYSSVIMDELLIYNKVLTEDEVIEIFTISK
jgi:hypothetical protein